MVVEQFFELRGESRLVAAVAETDGAAADLVFVGRTDAATRRADFLAAAPGRLARLIERDVRGQDQRTGAADAEPVAQFDAARFQSVDFAQQRGHTQHYAIADDANARRRAGYRTATDAEWSSRLQ